MIANMDQLVDFTQRLGDALPELRQSIVLRRPGCSLEAVHVLAKKLPGIPDTYQGVIRAINLDGVALGYFQLSPSTYQGRDLTEKVIACNDPKGNPQVKNHRKYGVYQVASWEADPIGVAFADGPFKVGQIVKYNIGIPGGGPVVLADSFEKFLLLAGNLDAIRDKYSEADNPAQALSEFQECVQCIAPITAGGWQLLARVVLS